MQLFIYLNRLKHEFHIDENTPSLTKYRQVNAVEQMMAVYGVNRMKFSLDQAVKAQTGSRCIALLFLQPRRKMGGGCGQRQAPPSLPPERPGTHCIEGWVGPMAGLDGCGKSRFPDRPARSESLYRLSHPGPS
jgi:hypothetical protein